MSTNSNVESRREEMLSKVHTAGSLPAIAMKVRQMAADPEVDFKKLAELIRYDPSITANILGVANMGRATGGEQVYSVKAAIVRLGTRRIMKIVLGLAMAPVLNSKVDGYGMASGELWKHCVGVAICAEKLAVKLRMKAPEYCFTAGLLHDIGKVVIGSQLKDEEQEKIAKLVEKEGMAYNEAEQAVLGIDHAEIGTHLIENWQLPEEYSLAVRYHHEPDKVEVDDPAVPLIHVADLLCLSAGVGMGSDGLNYKSAANIVEDLNLTHQIIESAVCETMFDLSEFEL